MPAASANSYVIDLYVDKKTLQFYAEPGEGRVRMGSFEKLPDTPSEAATRSASNKPAELPAPATQGGSVIAGSPEKLETAAVKPQGLGFSNWKSPDPFKFNLNPDGSQYLKFGFLNQVWLRYEQNNPGSQVLGEPVDDTTDISLRRTRFVLQGQLTDRVYF